MGYRSAGLRLQNFHICEGILVELKQNATDWIQHAMTHPIITDRFKEDGKIGSKGIWGRLAGRSDCCQRSYKRR